MSSNNNREVDNIISSFNRGAGQLLKIFEMIASSEVDSANVDRLRRRFQFARSNMPDLVISNAAEMFVSYADHIVAGPSEFSRFCNGFDIKTQVNDKYDINDDDSQFITNIITSIKHAIPRLSKEELTSIHGMVKSLLVDCTEYLIKTSSQ